MNRRGFVAGLALATMGAGRSQTRDTAQTKGAADPLMDPSSVGQLRAVATPLDNSEGIKAIERRLKCTCGCNLDIFTCRTTDFTCTYSPALHKEVVAAYSAGQTADQIVATFVAKYGESILLAPPAQGFNLLGYLAPGVAVLFAGSVLGFVLLRRHRQRILAQSTGSPGVAPTVPSQGLSAEQRQRLEQALSEIES